MNTEPAIPTWPPPGLIFRFGCSVVIASEFASARYLQNGLVEITLKSGHSFKVDIAFEIILKTLKMQ
jgi:hypothetical protein